jgi:hypothetical protein
MQGSAGHPQQPAPLPEAEAGAAEGGTQGTPIPAAGVGVGVTQAAGTSAMAVPSVVMAAPRRPKRRGGQGQGQHQYSTAIAQQQHQQPGMGQEVLQRDSGSVGGDDGLFSDVLTEVKAVLSAGAVPAEQQQYNSQVSSPGLGAAMSSMQLQSPGQSQEQNQGGIHDGGLEGIAAQGPAPAPAPGPRHGSHQQPQPAKRAPILVWQAE